MSRKATTVISCDTKVACNGNSTTWDGYQAGQAYPMGWSAQNNQDSCPACTKVINTPPSQPTTTQPTAAPVFVQDEAEA